MEANGHQNWLATFFKISYFEFCRRTRVIQVWDCKKMFGTTRGWV